MSNRILAWLGGLLLAAGILLLLLQFSEGLRRGDPALATVVFHAGNAGGRLAPADAAVDVFLANSPDAQIRSAAIDEPIELAPGSYDIRIRYTRTGDRQHLWLRGLSLESGERATRRVEFAAAEIKVEASVGSDGSEPGEVIVYVFKLGEHEQVLTTVPVGQPVLLGVGDYDLRVVWAVGNLEKDVRWFRNVQVKLGLQTGLQVDFDRGVLLVTAGNSGEPLPLGTVTLSVYRAGDEQRQVIDNGLAGAPLGLVSGAYDIRAVYEQSSDKPERWLRNVTIPHGETIERSVLFSSGTLVVTAALPGRAPLEVYDAYVYHYLAGDHEQAVSYGPAGKPAILEAGAYDVRVAFFRSHDQPDIWLRNVTVSAGSETLIPVQFSSGQLLVRAYNTGGEELIGDTIYLYLYTAGQHNRPVARVRSGELATVTAGMIDIRAVDTRSGATVSWLSNVRLQPGALTERSISVPDP